jgi:hypothetical protein
MWCSLANLILPLSVADAIALKGYLLMRQDTETVVLNDFTLVLLPFYCILLAWIFPLIVWNIARRKHPFIDESAENGFKFTFVISGLWLCGILPLTCLLIFIFTILYELKINKVRNNTSKNNKQESGEFCYLVKKEGLMDYQTDSDRNIRTVEIFALIKTDKSKNDRRQNRV